MELHIYEKVKVTRDVYFETRNVLVKKGTEGVIIDICNSLENPNKKGYVLELPEYLEFDPTFIFDFDDLEKIWQK